MIDIVEIILTLTILGLLISTKHKQVVSLFGGHKKLIVDSCGLIDGRIVPLVESRFVSGELVIPQFVLNELQLLADGSDSHKRERARFGLDVAHQLQDSTVIKVVIDRSTQPRATAIDDKLILLAKRLRAQLYTTDFNLSKVAVVEGVAVLNVNELAQNLRPVTLPGEALKIKIVQRGSGRDQGVGYLEDGTMIVVDGAAKYVGTVVPVTVTRMHQTVAGKMVFGQIRSERSDRHSVAGKPNQPRKSQNRLTRALTLNRR